MQVLFESFKDPKYRAAPLLIEMVEAGYLGRKTGRGLCLLSFLQVRAAMCSAWAGASARAPADTILRRCYTRSSLARRASGL